MWYSAFSENNRDNRHLRCRFDLVRLSAPKDQEKSSNYDSCFHLSSNAGNHGLRA